MSRGDDQPTWRLLLECAQELATRTPEFGRAELIACVQQSDPSRQRSSIDPIIQGMTDNASGGPRAACGEVFHRVARGRFVLREAPPAQAPLAAAPAQTPPRPPRQPSQKRARVDARLERVIERFDDLVAEYDARVPFVRSGQYQLHRATIERRQQHPSVRIALDDDVLLESLHRTLQAWGIGKRASRLVPLDDFRDAVRRQASRLESLESLRLEELAGCVDEVGAQIWTLVDELAVVENVARIVPGTKTLHHLLPQLVPPMDRAWTGRFFEWNPVDLQQGQRSTFLAAWRDLANVASATRPSRLVGAGWRTSSSKIVDNAVIAYTMR
jgi:hypothetical protein